MAPIRSHVKETADLVPPRAAAYHPYGDDPVRGGEMSKRDAETRRWICPVPGCTSDFAQKGDVRRHLILHAKDPRPWKCGQCRKAFAQHAAMIIHTYVHTGEKNFHCQHEHCDRRFADPSSAKRHFREVHLQERRITRANLPSRLQRKSLKISDDAQAPPSSTTNLSHSRSSSVVSSSSDSFLLAAPNVMPIVRPLVDPSSVPSISIGRIRPMPASFHTLYPKPRHNISVSLNGPSHPHSRCNTPALPNPHLIPEPSPACLLPANLQTLRCSQLIATHGTSHHIATSDGWWHTKRWSCTDGSEPKPPTYVGTAFPSMQNAESNEDHLWMLASLASKQAEATSLDVHGSWTTCTATPSLTNGLWRL